MLPAGKQLPCGTEASMGSRASSSEIITARFFFIRAHFAWLRNLGSLSIIALKNEGKRNLNPMAKEYYADWSFLFPCFGCFCHGRSVNSIFGQIQGARGSCDALRDNSCLTLFQTETWIHIADLTLLQ